VLERWNKLKEQLKTANVEIKSQPKKDDDDEEDDDVG
jgi:hypothetical protein